MVAGYSLNGAVASGGEVGLPRVGQEQVDILVGVGGDAQQEVAQALVASLRCSHRQECQDETKRRPQGQVYSRGQSQRQRSREYRQA